MEKRKLISQIQFIPIKLRVYRVLRTILVWFLFAATINLLLSYLFYTPKSYFINKENKVLLAEIYEMNETVSNLNLDTENLKSRYNNVYKAFFGMQENLPIEKTFEISDSKYRNIYQDRYQKTVVEAHKTQDNLSHKLVSLSYCLDSISSLALRKDQLLKSQPIISPIHKDNISYISDKYGWRTHPVTKRRQFHKGMDIACSRNTPVYSPADGVITLARYNGGYGRLIVIDHGFGYVTKFAHLNEYKVEVGQIVKRGEEIALSGNTGVSTGPHLHYEVLLNNKNVNPINYISNDMTVEEFTKILESAEIDTNKTIDNIDIFGSNRDNIIL